MKTSIVPVTRYLPFLIAWAILAMPVLGKPGKSSKKTKDEQTINGKKQIPEVSGSLKKDPKGKMSDPNLSNGWTYDPGYGWLYTDDKIYPFVYANHSKSWYRYQPGSENPRLFYSYREKAWEAWEPG